MWKQFYEWTKYKENESHERDKLLLKLENDLLRFERRLTSGRAKDEE